MNSTPDIITHIGKLEIFSDFSEPTDENKQLLEKVCAALTEQTFSAGDIIIHEGDVGSSLYILLEGDVQVIRSTPQGESFAVVNLSANQNVFFGEIAIVDHEQRSASVKALTQCRTLVLTAGDFISLCESNPQLGYKTLYRIARRLAGSLRESTRDLLTLYQALLDEVGNPS